MPDRDAQETLQEALARWRGGLTVTTRYDAATGQGLVVLLVPPGQTVIDLVPSGARDIALLLDEAAHEADAETYVLAFLRDRFGIVSAEARASILEAWRRFWLEWIPPEEEESQHGESGHA
jgi:hypothetical protein